MWALGSKMGWGMRKKIVKLLKIVVILGFSGIAQADLNNGLVAYYPFNGNVNDESGNANHGIKYGGINYIDGVFGKAASFDGINDYIKIPFQDIYTDTITIKISLWINTNILSDCKEGYGQSIISHSPEFYGYTHSLQLCKDKLKVYAFTEKPFEKNFSTNSQIYSNTWINITYVIFKSSLLSSSISCKLKL